MICLRLCGYVWFVTTMPTIKRLEIRLLIHYLYLWNNIKTFTNDILYIWTNRILLFDEGSNFKIVCLSFVMKTYNTRNVNLWLILYSFQCIPIWLFFYLLDCINIIWYEIDKIILFYLKFYWAAFNYIYSWHYTIWFNSHINDEVSNEKNTFYITRSFENLKRWELNVYFLWLIWIDIQMNIGT